MPTCRKPSSTGTEIFDVVAAAYGVETGGAFANAASQLYSQDFEREADYFGMDMLGRAGVPTFEVANFWGMTITSNNG